MSAYPSDDRFREAFDLLERRVEDRWEIPVRIRDVVASLVRHGAGQGQVTLRLAEMAAGLGEARRLGQAGRDSLLANGWTWAGNAARVVQVFEQLVEGGRA